MASPTFSSIRQFRWRWLLLSVTVSIVSIAVAGWMSSDPETETSDQTYFQPTSAEPADRSSETSSELEGAPSVVDTQQGKSNPPRNQLSSSTGIPIQPNEIVRPNFNSEFRSPQQPKRLQQSDGSRFDQIGHQKIFRPSRLNETVSSTPANRVPTTNGTEFRPGSTVQSIPQERRSRNQFALGGNGMDDGRINPSMELDNRPSPQRNFNFLDQNDLGPRRNERIDRFGDERVVQAEGRFRPQRRIESNFPTNRQTADQAGYFQPVDPQPENRLSGFGANGNLTLSGSNETPKQLPTSQFKKKELPGGVGTTNFQLATQPKSDDHYESRPPIAARDGFVVPYSKHDFAPDPMGIDYYDPEAQQQVYQGKTLNANQRPILELFKPWYQIGQIPKAKLWLGRHNPVIPQFLVYGDFRTAVASNTQNGNNFSVAAYRLNLDFDFRLTSTERFHWFMGPLDRGGQFTRFVRDNDDLKFISEFDPDIDFGYLEGDLGAIWGGFSKTSLPFDLPFAIGNMPLLFQNGVWLEDAFVGAAFTIPAKNSPALDISNYDITFIFGYDKINSAAFGNDDNAAKLYGVASFIEAAGGYFEMDYAFLEDRTNFNRSYHNTSIAYTRRYGRFVSNSIRLINNAGQNPNGIEQTADGTAILFENSLITRNPLTFVPYFNTFVGFDTPQSAARAGGAGGILRNTGILFESDGLTGFPTLDDKAKNAFGGALGLNILAKDLSQQLILEAAMVQPFSGKQSSAPAEQFGLGARYQLPLSNAIILRTDAMVGITDGRVDRHGVRIELRHKW